MGARESLVEATQDLLWERGYVGTSPKAILTRAGVGQGSMYHFFDGKMDLAAVALTRSGEAMRTASEVGFGADEPVFDRIAGYLLRERDVLKGCRMGRMTLDPEVVDSDVLRKPVDDTLRWHRLRLAELLADGQGSGELVSSFSPVRVAATITAVLQGGYVLARAAQSVEPFDDAVTGVIELLSVYRRTA